MRGIRGQSVTLRGEYFDHLGVPADPANPTVNLVDSFGVEQLAAGVPVHDGVGLFHYDYPIPQNAALGVWEVTWSGLMAGSIVSDDDSLEVLASAIGGGVAGLATGPCDPWATADDICMNTDELDPTVVDDAIDIATYVLWAASARVYGTCTLTVRPCKRGGCEMPGSWWSGAAGGYPWVPLLLGGVWTNIPCCSSGGCSCRFVDKLVLRTGAMPPVAEVIGVRVDGVALDPADWLLYNGSDLYRADGGRWPVCQDLSLADTEPDTWSVTYAAGFRVPTIGRRATGELAEEVIKLCTGESCKLPSRWQSITRQGLTIQRIDPSEIKGIGLRLCDLFINAVNPNGLAMPSGVYSIDAPAHPRAT